MAGMNTTTDFHRTVPIDLMKEFTLCESFAREDSEYSVALERPQSYGAMIGDYLTGRGLLKNRASICEMGCGYGSLMAGLLERYGDIIERVTMIDLSGRLLRRQRSTLAPWLHKITSLQADIHAIVDAVRGMDLFIVNEVMGDLNTLTDLNPSALTGEAGEVIETYGLEMPERTFHLNIGAIRLVEALCRKGIPAFLTEHSSDPIIPDDMAYLKQDLEQDSYPREIKLYRHSEYTIRFSHLVKVAESHGKVVNTGPLLDIVPIRRSPEMRMIFTAKASSTDRREIILELLDHIREYRYITIT